MAHSVEFEVKKTQIIKLLPHLMCTICAETPNAQSPSQEKFRCLNPSDPHLHCYECKEKCVEIEGGKCTIYKCKRDLCTIACPLISSLVDTLPFCCTNRPSGCQEVLFQEEMKTHLSRCIFEDVSCINTDCPSEGFIPFKDYMDHLVLPDCSTIPEVQNKVKIKLDDEDTYHLPSQVQKNPLNKPLFYFYCNICSGIVYAWIYYLGFKEDTERFTYSLEVNSTRSIKFSGPVKSIFEDPYDIIHEQDALMIGLPIGKMLCKESEDSALVFDIEIFDKKEEVKDDSNDSAMSDD